MSYISETLRACMYLLDKAAAHNFDVDTMGSAHGSIRLRKRAKHEKRTRLLIHERRRSILALLRQGHMSQNEIAQHIGCGKQLVSHVAGLWRQGKCA